MIISVMPKDGGGLRGKLVCFSPTDLHNPIWSSAAMNVLDLVLI